MAVLVFEECEFECDVLEMLGEMLGENVSTEEILEDFPDLEREDIQACLIFAARRTEFPRLTA